MPDLRHQLDPQLEGCLIKSIKMASHFSEIALGFLPQFLSENRFTLFGNCSKERK